MKKSELRNMIREEVKLFKEAAPRIKDSPEKKKAKKLKEECEDALGMLYYNLNNSYDNKASAKKIKSIITALGKVYIY